MIDDYFCDACLTTAMCADCEARADADFEEWLNWLDEEGQYDRA